MKSMSPSGSTISVENETPHRPSLPGLSLLASSGGGSLNSGSGMTVSTEFAESESSLGLTFLFCYCFFETL